MATFEKFVENVDDRTEGSGGIHIIEKLQVAQNDLRKAEIKFEPKSHALQCWLQLTYELELRNYNARKAVAQQQLQMAKERGKKFINIGDNFMDVFSIDESSVDDVDSPTVKAKDAVLDLTNDLHEIMHRWKQIEMLCGFPIILNPGITYLKRILHANLVNGDLECHSDATEDSLRDQSTNKGKLSVENTAELVATSKKLVTDPSSPTKKQQITESSSGLCESDETLIIPPAQTSQPQEIIIHNAEGNIPISNKTKVSKHEMNHSMSSNKSTTTSSVSSSSITFKTSDAADYSTVPPVSQVVYPKEALQPPKLSLIKTENEDWQIVKAKDDSMEQNLAPPSLSPCPHITHAPFTTPDRHTARDIKRQYLRPKERINYEEDESEFVSDYEELVEEKKAKISLDEPRSEYEKEIQERRAKNLEFLKSIGLDVVKQDFIDAVNSAEKKKKRKRTKKSETPIITRTSARRKEAIYYTEDMARWIHERKMLLDEVTFQKVLKSDKFYEDFVKDFSGIVTDNCVDQKPVLYNKDVLKQLSQKTDLWSSKIYSPSALTWYPSTEHFVLAVGDCSGNLGLWNIKESNYKPHIFSIHPKRITHLQFNPCNQCQLISSSSDGRLLCFDMQKHIVSEVLRFSDNYATYFDLYSPSTYLLSLTNGQVAIADRRCETESYRQRRYVCHDTHISTVNVHPLAKDYFVTAGSDRRICVWDVRKLTDSVIANTSHRDTVCSAFFSPISGKFLLSTSRDDTVCVFDSTDIAAGNMKLHKKMRYMYFKDACRRRLLWLPNSDDTFACSNKDPLTVLQIYDKDLNVYEAIPDGTPGVKYFNIFHPFKAAFASVTQSGFIKVSS